MARGNEIFLRYVGPVGTQPRLALAALYRFLQRLLRWIPALHVQRGVNRVIAFCEDLRRISYISCAAAAAYNQFSEINLRPALVPDTAHPACLPDTARTALDGRLFGAMHRLFTDTIALLGALFGHGW